MVRTSLVPVVLCALLLTSPEVSAQPKPAGGADGWKTVSRGKIEVRSRARKGTPVKEYWVETEFDAEVRDLQDVLVNAERFREFMPYVKESRYVARPDADGSQYVYVKLDPPGVGPRDYIVRSYVTRSVNPDGSGEFENAWQAVPDKLPKRAHTVRLTVNDGSWKITPAGNGKSHAVYKFAVDPGPGVPGFAADMANQTAIPNSLQAIEKEARKRAAARKK